MPHLVLLVRREHRDDSVDRLGRVERVQRRQHEVAGLGGDERRLDRFHVAHFADQNHVRVLAQRAAQAGGVVERVEADFALRHDGLLVVVHEFDRVFNREDVQRAHLVDAVRPATRASCSCRCRSRR